MRKLAVLLFVLFLGLPATAQPMDATQAALRDAQQLIDYMTAFDAEGILSLTYTKPMLSRGVTLDYALGALTQLNQHLKNIGVEYTRFEAGQPSELFERPEGLFIIVPYVSESYRLDRGAYMAAFFIGCSEDGGATWTFIDGAGTLQNPIEHYLPNYNGPELPEIESRPL